MRKLINSIRFLGVDAVNNANSGHPGICLGAAPMITELFVNHLKINPKNDQWFNRDRFVMGAGHGSALLYSILFHLGYQITLKDLMNFRQLDSATPGHPEFGHTHGIDSTSGPLGQGFAQAVGMAIAEKFLAKKYNKKGFKVVDHYTFCLTCDGELQEGVAQEAMSLAGHLGLNKLILLFDSNDVQLDGPVSDAYSDDLAIKCKAVNWQHILIKNGEDTKAIAKAITKAKINKKQPTIIEIKTKIGLGTSIAGTAKCHGAPIGNEERAIAAKFHNHNTLDFEIDGDVVEQKKNIIKNKLIAYKKDQIMNKNYRKTYPNLYKELTRAIIGNYDDVNCWSILASTLSKQATRNSAQEAMAELAKAIPTLLAGSADLKSSTKIFGAVGNFPKGLGRNINFGVREFAMISAINGMTLHGGVKAVGSGFFIFSDYAKPAIRLAALQHLPAIFVFSHDSVAIGEDGPTHQPIEQLTGLRAIPNLNVVRPADRHETLFAFTTAIKEQTRPTVIVTSRQDLVINSKATQEEFDQGAYIIQKETKKFGPNFTIIATGSEVATVIEALKTIKGGKKIRVVSMPSTNNFDLLSIKEQRKIIPMKSRTLFIEASDATFGYKYAQKVHGINHFGASGKGSEVQAKCQMSVKHIKNIIFKFQKGE